MLTIFCSPPPAASLTTCLHRRLIACPLVHRFIEAPSFIHSQSSFSPSISSARQVRPNQRRQNFPTLRVTLAATCSTSYLCQCAEPTVTSSPPSDVWTMTISSSRNSATLVQYTTSPRVLALFSWSQKYHFAHVWTLAQH
jgi:hypothetical protein